MAWMHLNLSFKRQVEGLTLDFFFFFHFLTVKWWTPLLFNLNVKQCGPQCLFTPIKGQIAAPTLHQRKGSKTFNSIYMRFTCIKYK